MQETDMESNRLPIKLDSTSNGEFEPVPLQPVHRHARELALVDAAANAKRQGLRRRDFLVSACGAASTLLAFNKAYAAAGKTGGFYELAAASALDPGVARAALGGDEFIFDVQGHYVNPTGAWLKSPHARPLSFRGMEKTACELSKRPGDLSFLGCLSADEFVKDVFMDSDTDIMVLTYPPSHRDAEPLTIEEAHATARIVDRLQGAKRLLLHGRVNPNQDGDLQGMDELAERWKVSAWKTFTQWGPYGQGYFLSDEIGLAFIEKARKLGIRNICVHKGVPFGPESYRHSLCDDIGVVARRYPDVNFLVYHSGYVVGKTEGPYDPTHNEGVDSLIRTVLKHEVPKGGNVYAELGTTWRYLMRDPDGAAHTLGKLCKYLGPDNVLWGTDSIWYGSPQDQIQAFRTFQIAPALRERYGYPELTPELRAKVFGLNALRAYGLSIDKLRQHTASDHIATQRAEYRQAPTPHFRTYGPRTRREFLHLHAWQNAKES